MPACESKLVSRSSRKATVARTVLIGQAQVLRLYAKPKIVARCFECWAGL